MSISTPNKNKAEDFQYHVDVQRAEQMAGAKDFKRIRGPKALELITQHTVKFYKMGLLAPTIARILGRSSPEFDSDKITLLVSNVWERWKKLRPTLFASESLIDQEDRDHAFDEEPSDFPASRLADIADVEQGWIVQDMIPDDDAILNQGDGGAGKTTTMLQLAVAAATGREWLGMPTVEEPIGVMFFSCEERTKKVRMRIKAIIQGASNPYDGEVTWADLAKLRIIGLADRDALIAVKDSSGRIVATEMFQFFKNKIKKHKPKLVIIDSLYDVYGGDENTRAQVRQFVSLLRRFTSRFGCGLIVLGHPSLYGMASGTGTSGSTGWRNAFRGMLYTTIDKKKSRGKNATQVHKIEVMKGNYGPPSTAIELIWRDGVFVPLTEEEAQDAKAKTAEAVKEKFLELLASFVSQNRKVTTAPKGSYAPREFAKHPQSGDFTEDDFVTAMNILLDERSIAMRRFTNMQRKPDERLEVVEFEGGDDDEPDFG